LKWKEFLEDYEAKELEEYGKFKKRIIDGKFGPDDVFPQTNRFPELRKPISRVFDIIESSAQDSIWSRIPLAGSSIQGLPPYPESMFSRYVGFSPKQIPEVIEFTKETGKLQFVLRHFPTKYLKCEYLEPIFSELRPPVGVNFPPDFFFEKREWKRGLVEFDTLAELKAYPHIRSWSLDATGTIEPAEVLIGQYRHTYMGLKALGYRRIVEELENSLVTAIDEAAKIITIAGLLITQPFFDPLVHSFAYDTSFYSLAVGFAKAHSLDIPTPTFPVEIGEFVIRKLVHCAPSLNSCKQLIYEYEDTDLYKLHNALAEGIVKNAPDVVTKSSKDLSVVLDDIWKDKSLPKRVRELKVGVPVLFGVVGGLACGISGGIGGILAGLGFSVIDKLLGGTTEGIAEKIAKLRSPNWEVIVYDFKKKYSLNTSNKRLGK
jgi:hypothetical protein